MLNKKLLYITTVGLMSSVFSINTKAQTFYQCVPAIEKEDWNKTPILTAPVGTCTSINVKPGLYLVYLRGGKGGDCELKKSEYAPYIEGISYGINKGKKGGYVEYRFKVEGNTDIKLCAGGNGYDSQIYAKHSNTTSFPYVFYGSGSGGGSASWIKIGNEVIIAYGGNGVGSKNKYINHDNNSEDISQLGGYGGTFGIGGDGKKTTANSCSSCNNSITQARGGYCAEKTYTGNLYPGYINNSYVSNGETEASASHQSNVSLKLSCQDPDKGCAELYAWRAN